MDSKPPANEPTFKIKKSGKGFLGLSLDDLVRSFFGGNALVSVIVLTLITVFLFREGVGFFGQNQQNISIYRQAGLEYVDHMNRQVDDHTAHNRYLSDLRLRQFTKLRTEQGLELSEVNAALSSFDEFSWDFSDTVDPLRDFDEPRRVGCKAAEPSCALKPAARFRS